MSDDWQNLIDELAKHVVERLEADGWLHYFGNLIAEDVMENLNENVALGQAIAKLQEANRRADSG